jgi:hypothetical protein
MGASARVLSVESVAAYRAALAKFAARATDLLGGAALVVTRALDELEERHRHWVHAIREQNEEVARLRSALSFARMGKDGSSAGCGELELELIKARRRLREAEAKLEAVQRWQRTLPSLVRDYEGPARRLSGFLESDVGQALAFLDDKAARLEEYLATVAPAPEASDRPAVPELPPAAPEAPST